MGKDVIDRLLVQLNELENVVRDLVALFRVLRSLSRDMSLVDRDDLHAPLIFLSRLGLAHVDSLDEYLENARLQLTTAKEGTERGN